MTVKDILKRIKSLGCERNALGDAVRSTEPMRWDSGQRFLEGFTKGWKEALETVEFYSKEPERPQGGWYSEPEMVDDECRRCLHWYSGVKAAVCRRYPGTLEKKASDWCGEFKEQP